MKTVDVKLSELKKHPTFSKLLPRQSKGEFASLKASVKRHGMVRPDIVVNEQYEVIDGYHLWAAGRTRRMPNKPTISRWSSPCGGGRR